MSVVGHGPPPFFKRGPAPLARLLFFVSAAVLLLVADLHFRFLEPFRQGIALATYPLQQAVSAPVSAIGNAGEYFSSVSGLRAQNAALERRQIEAAAAVHRLDKLETENQHLRALLELKARQPVGAVVSEVVRAARDPFSRRVILDKGTQQGLASAQVVIDEHGVIGQVTRVYPLYAEVTLVTDKDHAVPVQVARTGLRTIVFGAGEGALELRYLPANTDIQNGDVLVTSGLDGVYLPGLPVARVVRVVRDNDLAFARIVAQPLAVLERHRQVLVLALPQALPDLPEVDAPAREPKRAHRRAATP